jgi:acyl-CoA synthetase (AMP-forming)/AMP-acid ligase II
MKVSHWSCQEGVWLPLQVPGLQVPPRESFLAFKKEKKLGDILVFPSSGTGGLQAKWVVLSWKEGVLQSYQILHELGWLSFKKWGLMLPTFHVGGFFLILRAHLAGGEVKIFERPWDPVLAYEFLNKQSIEILSLVPTQLYDFIKKGYQAPSSLRCLVVGGAFLSEDLLQKALALGWPVFLTFGMTETNAFFAYKRTEDLKLRFATKVTLTSEKKGDSERGSEGDSERVDQTPKLCGFKTIEGYQVKIGEDSSLKIRSDFLFQGYFQDQIFYEPLRDDEGFWQSSDLAVSHPKAGGFEVLGRSQWDYVKIKGEGVFLLSLKNKIQTFFLEQLEKQKNEPLFKDSGEVVSFSLQDFELLACPCLRKGSCLVWLYGGDSHQDLWSSYTDLWNQQCLGFERLQYKTYHFSLWPRTSLGKIQISLLRQQVCQLDP